MKNQLISQATLKISGILLLLCASNTTLSHHSFSANFDANKTIEVVGVVTEFSFRNPHVLILLDVTGEDGVVTNWMAEGAAATGWRRGGWEADSLKAGDTMSISGNATHDGSPMLSLRQMALLNPSDNTVIAQLSTGQSPAAAMAQAQIADTGGDTGGGPGPGGDRGMGGQRGAGGEPGAGGERGAGGQRGQRNVVQDYSNSIIIPSTLPTGEPNLSGFWGGHRISPYNPPKDPQFIYNEAGSELKAAVSLANDPQVFCDRPGLIRQASLTSYIIRIEQLVDRVIFEYEEYGFTRTIYFDDRNALGVHSHFGDSIARYEGDTLVIETTNLLPNWASPEGNRLSDQTTVVERYRRADEPEYGSILHMESTISDPVFLREDYVLTNIKINTPEIDFIENGCQPPPRARVEVHPYMNFFLTSEDLGDGTEPGGLEGANAQCTNLASTVGKGDKTWRAYLNNTAENDINARDRIGSGPWYSANGELVPMDLEGLLSDPEWFNHKSAVNEQGRKLALGVQDNGLGDVDGLLYCFGTD